MSGSEYAESSGSAWHWNSDEAFQNGGRKPPICENSGCAGVATCIVEDADSYSWTCLTCAALVPGGKIVWQNATVAPLVGNFCAFCFGKQLYRAGFNPVRRVKIKCRYCGQGEEDEKVPNTKAEGRVCKKYTTAAGR